MKYVCMASLMLLFISCKNDDDTVVVNNPTVFGLSYALSGEDFSTTYSNLRNLLQADANISITAEVNHTVNAMDVGQEIRDTRLILFEYPSLATPVLQTSQLAGLELPLKMMVYDDADSNVFVAFNSADYIGARCGVNGASTLPQINSTLNNFGTTITNVVVSENPSGNVSTGDGIITLVSQNDFSTTYNNLRNAVSDNSELEIIAEVDHQSNAQAAGLDLGPTKVIIFGNPTQATPLLQSAQTMGIDLPLKILVWEEGDGTVNISYNNIDYLATRHAVTGNEEILTQISSLLANLAVNASN